MKSVEIEFMPDKLISQPVVFLGLSDTEIVWISVVGLIVWIPISCITLSVFGLSIFGIPLGFVMMMVSVFVLSRIFQRLKTRYPDGLHLIYVKKYLQRYAGIDFGYIDVSQYWDIRRIRQ